jgi:hypothetical protein
MSPAQIAEARALICSAMADIGGACERLREIEEGMMPFAVAESAEEIATWLSQAGDRLNEAALVAEGTLKKEGAR